MAVARYLGMPRGIECDAEKSSFGSEEDRGSADVQAKPTLAELGGLNIRIGALKDKKTLRQQLVDWMPQTVISFEDDPVLRSGDWKLVLLLIPDPTHENRWNEVEIRAFCETAVELRRRLSVGEKVLVLCRGGKNRSRALARSAMMDTDALSQIPVPVDEKLEELATHALKNASAALKLAPIGVRERHKRSRDD